MIKSTFLEYQKTLPKAEEIYIALQGRPKTHIEWANSFNKIGDINKILRR
jgi:hypothetical protein